MKLRIAAIAVSALFCCLSCVETNSQLGGNLVPINQTYKIYTAEAGLEEVYMRMADSLSGYSSKRITIGAIRDAEYGLTTRSCALTMVPVFVDTLDLGKNPKFKRMIFQVAKDTTSFSDPNQEAILQNINVYELSRPIDASKDYNCNSTVPHLDKRITEGRLIYDGGDSLSFNFSEEFAKRFLELKDSDVQDIDTYFKKFPGIFIDVDTPHNNGGRLDLFELQLGYNSDYDYITGNYAALEYQAEYDGELKDTSLLFLLGAYDFNDVDSLITNSSSSFPQYCLNFTGHQTRGLSGKATQEIKIEGGGGLKPFISAKYLKTLAENMIASTGNDPTKAVINKATIVLPFEFPSDYKDIDSYWPDYLSPTIRVVTDTTTAFSSLSDSSSEEEDPGSINRSLCYYAPDITYHMQQILSVNEKDASATKTKQFNKGMYDVWFLIMADEITVTKQSSDSDLSEYYNYLAYQSYYGSMYGGYSSSYGGDSYSNYYNYMMMAQYASQSSSYESASVEMDKDRYYRAALNGPTSKGSVPKLKLVFSIPNE